MPTQSVVPPAPPALPPCEFEPFCPEAQADGVPCADSSSVCGSCAHLAEAITGVGRSQAPGIWAERKEGAHVAPGQA